MRCHGEGLGERGHTCSLYQAHAVMHACHSRGTRSRTHTSLPASQPTHSTACVASDISVGLHWAWEVLDMLYILVLLNNEDVIPAGQSESFCISLQSH